MFELLSCNSMLTGAMDSAVLYECELDLLRSAMPKMQYLPSLYWQLPECDLLH